MNFQTRSLTAATLLVALLGSAMLLAGCVSPGAIAPSAREIELPAAPDAPASVKIADAWWRGFGDEHLTSLVQRSLASNPTLATVRLRIERAAAVVDASEAARKPRIDGSAGITRERFTINGPYPAPLAGSVRTVGTLAATGSLEFDAFGRQRATLDGAIGSQRAAQADYQAARVLLASDLVRLYVQLALQLDQREVLERSLAQREEILALTRRRVDLGLDTAVELRQSEGAVPEIRAAIESLRVEAELTRHALAELEGGATDAERELAPHLGKVTLVPLPSAVPADLLGRRADIAAARWRVEAATRDLQASRAQFYPSINLVAFAGFTSLGLNNLLDAGSRQLGAGPALSLPIFDAGRLRANYRSKASEVDIAVENYNASVLQAVREAADALSLVQSIEVQQREQTQALSSAQAAYALALERYRGGLGSYLTVLSAETNVLAQRRAHNDLKARALETQVRLAHALGGGYVEA